MCLGNICRSPAAEAVFAELAAADGVDVTVDSAGTSRYHLGESPHEHTRGEARRRGIAIDHRGRQFTAADFDASTSSWRWTRRTGATCCASRPTTRPGRR